jgi:glycosyltransferase involved in cell wall biosynthesis
MRAATRLGLKCADRVIVPSGWVREALVRRYRFARERIDVVPLAPAAAEAPVTDPARLADVRRRYALPDRFLLSVGTLEPGKNRDVLLAAIRQLEPHRIALPLLVAGQRGWLAGGANGGDRVRLLGYVPDADLAALYSLAAVFVFPSWLEGFGLPPLEALACGTPVVASNRPAMPEVLGDAALYADPRRPDEWADAIARLASDASLREEMIDRGSARARLYSWERTARETLAAYAAALGFPRLVPLP